MIMKDDYYCVAERFVPALIDGDLSGLSQLDINKMKMWVGDLLDGTTFSHYAHINAQYKMCYITAEICYCVIVCASAPDVDGMKKIDEYHARHSEYSLGAMLAYATEYDVCYIESFDDLYVTTFDSRSDAESYIIDEFIDRHGIPHEVSCYLDRPFIVRDMLACGYDLIEYGGEYHLFRDC